MHLIATFGDLERRRRLLACLWGVMEKLHCKMQVCRFVSSEVELDEMHQAGKNERAKIICCFATDNKRVIFACVIPNQFGAFVGQVPSLVVRQVTPVMVS